MQNKVAPVAVPSESPHGRLTAGGASAKTATSGTVPEKPEVELRLIIEEDLAAESYVYKTINSRTGEVVQQYPREEVLRMREDANYHAGGVIRTKA
jgi:flagellar protein FlaG